jgi:hypothetical protein
MEAVKSANCCTNPREAEPTTLQVASGFYWWIRQTGLDINGLDWTKQKRKLPVWL